MQNPPDLSLLRQYPRSSSHYVSPDGRIFRLIELQPVRYWRNKLYRCVTVYNSTVDRPTTTVHRIVAETFLGPAPFDGAIIRHLNDDPSDNKAENLAWGSHKDNAADRDRNGNTPRGVRNHSSVLTDALVQQMLQDYNTKEFTQRDLATKFKVSITTVAKILRREAWTHVEGPVTSSREVKSHRMLGNTYNDLKKTDILAA